MNFLLLASPSKINCSLLHSFLEIFPYQNSAICHSVVAEVDSGEQRNIQ